MNPTIATASADSVRKINRAIVKKVAVHVIVAVASTAAVVTISSLAEKHHAKKEESTED